MEPPFKRIAERIDRFNAAIGRAASWCSLFIVLAEFAMVLMRYALGVGSIGLQESVLYAQAALFLLAAAWTLQRDGHVRVDIFYAPARPRTRALIDLCGALVFLLPFAAVLALVSIPYAARSWDILERSREASGLPFVYLFKTLIPVFAFLIGLQGVAQTIRAALVLIAPSAPDPRFPPASAGGKAAGALNHG
jgi:TRAP-type mannitol/chloroaromatic compound transport system permease small subunit